MKAELMIKFKGKKMDDVIRCLEEDAKYFGPKLTKKKIKEYYTVLGGSPEVLKSSVCPHILPGDNGAAFFQVTGNDIVAFVHVSTNRIDDLIWKCEGLIVKIVKRLKKENVKIDGEISVNIKADDSEEPFCTGFTRRTLSHFTEFFNRESRIGTIWDSIVVFIIALIFQL